MNIEPVYRKGGAASLTARQLKTMLDQIPDNMLDSQVRVSFDGPDSIPMPLIIWPVRDVVFDQISGVPDSSGAYNCVILHGTRD